MKRSWSVQYRRPSRKRSTPTSRQSSSNNNNESLRLSQSINSGSSITSNFSNINSTNLRTPDAYDASTDKGIFELGDAALDAGFDLTKLDDSKDLFEQFDNLLKDVSAGKFKDGEKTVTVSKGYSTDKGGTVSVRTVTSTPQGGQRVQTKVLQQGPVKKLTRIKITRLPHDGATPENLDDLPTQTIDVPYGTDLSSIDAETLKELLKFSDSKSKSKPKIKIDDPESGKKHAASVAVDIIPEDNENYPLQFSSDDSDLETNKENNKDINTTTTTAANTTTTTTPNNITNVNSLHLLKPPAQHIQPPSSSSLKRRRTYRPSIILPSASEIFDAKYEKYSSCCGLRFKLRNKKLLIAATKTMAVSEVDSKVDDAFTGLQTLVANYAKMLKDDRLQFTRILFRAVKLNRLDATRILCKVATSTGIQLSSLREPESSATLLHVALLCDNEKIVKHLVEVGDCELITATYINADYRNQTALHVAVANGKTELLNVLLKVLTCDQASDLLNTIADGKYFINEHRFGQICMTIALWAGHGHLLDYLVSHGCRLDLRDTFGNTPLHSLIHMAEHDPDRRDWEDLYDAMFSATATAAKCELQMDFNVSRNMDERGLEIKQKQLLYFRHLISLRDKQGRTVLSLAANICPRMLKHILNTDSLFKVPQNKLGSIAFVTYDVTDVTSYARGKYNKWSVLHSLVHSKFEQANFDKGSQPLQALLAMKWDVYRWCYLGWLFLHLIYMMIFTFSTAGESSFLMKTLYPNTNNNNNNRKNRSQQTMIINMTLQTTAAIIDKTIGTSSTKRYQYSIFCLLPITYIFLELVDLFGHPPYRCQMAKNLKSSLKAMLDELSVAGNAPYRAISIAFSISQLIWYVFYLQTSIQQDVALSLSLLFGWFFILFFTRACRVTSRFSIMMQKIFFRDLLYFLAVYSVIILSFTFSLNALVQSSSANILYDLLNVVLDLDQRDATEELSSARNILAAKVLLIFYAILAVVLLMNMLIAMMNTSYESVRLSRSDLWKRQQLSVLLMMERRLPCFARFSERNIWQRFNRSYFDVTVTQNNYFQYF